jgi:predicted transcriptional regulator
MKNIPKLTDLEITIMGVMWEQGMDMTIQEIADCLAEKQVSSSSVSQAVKRMIKKNAVTVSERRPVANVYARVLRPNFDRSEFVKAEVERLGGKMFFRKQLGMAGVVAELLRGDTGEISQKEMKELREIIDGKKKMK